MREESIISFNKMKKATLPIETACEPTEKARHSLCNDDLSFSNKTKHNLFPSNNTRKCDAQSSVCKELLSQPIGLTHRERLQWLQKRRIEGLWVQCDDCKRWRYLPQVIDRYELPQKWYCKMNPDTNLARCSDPEDSIHLHDEEDLIHSRFSAGSVVWARLPGWPWWPAMVDDCPDTEQFYWLDGFSDIPTHYNVVFFDKTDVTRAWISSDNIVSYGIDKKTADRALQIKKYRKRLIAATKQADDALKLPLSSRLAKYSFITRYKGNISSPTQITKADIEKYRKRLKRKFNVEFPSDSSDIENDSPTELNGSKVTNDSMLCTPKKSKVKAIKPKSIFKKTKGKIRTDTTLIVNESNHSEVEETFNESNYLAVHVDSALDTGLVNGSFDNDTSNTYAPESLISNTVEEPESQFPHGQSTSPGSGDFDF